MKHIEGDDPGSESILSGQSWSATLSVHDDHGRYTSDTFAVGVVDDQAAPVPLAVAEVVRLSYGRYRVNVTGALDPGTYYVTVAGTSDSEMWSFEVAGDPVAVPDVDAIVAYLGDDVAGQFTTDEITEALAAERQRQRDACTIPARYTSSLAEALRRRVQRNLAMKALPLALQNDSDGDAVRLGGVDPIVRDIEARYPKGAAG